MVHIIFKIAFQKINILFQIADLFFNVESVLILFGFQPPILSLLSIL